MRIRLLRYTMLVMIIMCHNGLYAQNSADSLAIKQIEWVALQIGFGNYKTLIRTSLATQRWKHFYWSPFCAEFGGDTNKEQKFQEIILIMGGTCVGLPIYLGSTKQHEIRIGAGLALGGSRFTDESVRIGSGRTEGCCAVSNINLSYIWHMGERFGWQASVDFVFIPEDELGDYSKPPRSTAFFLGFLY